MAEEESLLEQLQGMTLSKVSCILSDLRCELGHPLSDVEGALGERKALIQAIEGLVEERPRVKRLRQREEELRLAREHERRQREEEERRAREEEERRERERKEAAERKLKEMREEEERKENHERALRASPTWPVRWGAYLLALPKEMREAYLRKLGIKQLVQHLEESGVDPAMPPVEKDDYIAVLAESSAERIERERKALAERLEREQKEAEERAAREEQELRARAEAEERKQHEAELAELQRVEARKKWEALANASQSEREAFLELKTLDELKQMLEEAQIAASKTPIEKYDFVVLLALPPDERRRQEEAEAMARKEAENLIRRLEEELKLWAASPEWRSRRLAYIRSLSLQARHAHFGARTVSELGRLVSLTGLSPVFPPATDGADAERLALINALVEPAAERCERLQQARNKERERERLRKEEEQAGPGTVNREAYMRRSVKELRQMLHELGIPASGATEKQDLVELLLAAPQQRPQASEPPPPAADTKAADAEASPLDVADRVVVVGLKGQATLNGKKGQLVAMDGERWVVRLEGFHESKKIKPANLELLHVPVKLAQGCSLHIVVSKPQKESLPELRWDEACRCFHGHLVLSNDAQPKHFTVLVNGQPNACLHPDVDNACPFFEHGLRGPDANSQNMHWVIGSHPLDRASGGSSYQVRIFVTPDGSAKHLDWVRLAAGDDVTEAVPRCEAPVRPECPAPVRLPRYSNMCICGSWTDWALQRMTWNDVNMCYTQRLPWIGMEGCELFQLVLDADWKKVLHPDRPDACPEIQHQIAGPDDKNHDLNWAIVGAKGQYYEVRVNLSPFDGGVESIEWFQITAQEFKATTKRVPPKLPKFSHMAIVGSWTDWKQIEDMTWNAERREYLFAFTVGRTGQESFQILLDGHWHLCLHPDEPCCNPTEETDVCGPDNDNHGKNWTVGKRKQDVGARGKKFQVCLSISADGCAQKVDWRQL